MGFFDGFDDEAKGLEGLTVPERLGAMNGRRNSPAWQIASGLSRMQDNIKSIRDMRQQKLMEDKKNEFALKKADIGIQEMELQLGPDGAAAAREEFNLKKKQTQINSQIADRKLQRAQLSAEEDFAGGVNFVRSINKRLEQQRKEENDDFFLQAGIDKDGNYTLSDKKQASEDKIKELALKAAGDDMDSEKYEKALNLLRGSAAPVPGAEELGSTKAIKDGQKARSKNGKIIQYNAKTRKWALV